MNHQPRKRVSLKSISAARRDLILCMHEKQFGTIRNLSVIAGEPILTDAKIIRRHNLAKQVALKPASRNFNLKAAHLRLLETLDRVSNGTLELITFRDGLPCEIDECET